MVDPVNLELDQLMNTDSNGVNTWNILNRKKHIARLVEALTCELPKEFEKLVPAQTWTIYWITHSLNLLGQQQFLKTITSEVIKFISECAHEAGGYGGGPGQIAHLATSYAAVNALITLDDEQALESMDRVNLVKFLHRMKQKDGSFSLHDDGEIDSRASYCALAILRALNIEDPILLENVADWVLACQTYEGGFGSVPGSEAHGGYSFCCVATLCLMNQLHRADIPALLRWLTSRQLDGFCGRSNKLVDSCYSFWQGAIFPLVHSHLELELANGDHDETDQVKTRSQREKFQSTSKLFESWLYDSASLQEFILNKCQTKCGLLRDKPGHAPDFYHTCYALSGLSLSQHQPDGSIFDIGLKQANILDTTHPLFNLSITSLNDCFEYFRNKKIEIDYESSTAARDDET